MTYTKHIVIASILAAQAAFGGILTIPAKIAAKIAGHSADNVVAHVATHSADNVAEHVVTHNADDIAKAAAKGGAKAAAQTAPKVAKAVDAAIDAARIEAEASKPVVKAIHRAPIVKPGHLAAGGVGIGTVVAANNLTVGERDIDLATGDAIRNNPDIARVRVEASGRWKEIVAKWLSSGTGVGIGMGGVLLCLAFALKIMWPLLPMMRNRRKQIAVSANEGTTATPIAS